MMASLREGSPMMLGIIVHKLEVARAQSATIPRASRGRGRERHQQQSPDEVESVGSVTQDRGG